MATSESKPPTAETAGLVTSTSSSKNETQVQTNNEVNDETAVSSKPETVSNSSVTPTNHENLPSNGLTNSTPESTGGSAIKTIPGNTIQNGTKDSNAQPTNGNENTTSASSQPNPNGKSVKSMDDIKSVITENENNEKDNGNVNKGANPDDLKNKNSSTQPNSKVDVDREVSNTSQKSGKNEQPLGSANADDINTRSTKTQDSDLETTEPNTDNLAGNSHTEPTILNGSITHNSGHGSKNDPEPSKVDSENASPKPKVLNNIGITDTTQGTGVVASTKRPEFNSDITKTDPQSSNVDSENTTSDPQVGSSDPKVPNDSGSNDTTQGTDRVSITKRLASDSDITKSDPQLSTADSENASADTKVPMENQFDCNGSKSDPEPSKRDNENTTVENKVLNDKSTDTGQGKVGGVGNTEIKPAEIERDGAKNNPQPSTENAPPNTKVANSNESPENKQENHGKGSTETTQGTGVATSTETKSGELDSDGSKGDPQPSKSLDTENASPDPKLPNGSSDPKVPNVSGSTETSQGTDVASTEKRPEFDPVMKTVYLGSCPLDALPPLSKKAVRIFVSSTFSDTKEERNALMKNVYPKLAEYCRDKHGLEFQVVDMRWGVPEQAADNHSTTDLCIQEIHKCRDVSVGPCFVAIIGNKYGYRPIPTEIEEHLFQQLAQVAGEDADWQQIVSHWYLRDDNARPVVYVLQPISTKIPEVNDPDKEKQRAAWKVWDGINVKLTNSLRSTANKAYEAGKVTEEQQHAFYMSVTENEVTHGMLKANESAQEHSSICILRKIPDIEKHLEDPRAQKFIDLQSQNATAIDKEAQTLLDDLKDKKLRNTLTNLTQIEIEWDASGAHISLEDVPNVVDESKIADERVALHKDYLNNVCGEFFEKIRCLIDKGSVKQSDLYTEMTSEILQHFHMAKARCHVFEGREDIIAKAKQYLEGNCNVPFTIYGKSGCGKTSVMAKILEHCTSKKWLGKGGKPFVPVIRFLGTTPRTSNLFQLLDNLCAQLSILCGKKWEVPDKFKDLTLSLLELMKLISTKQSIVLMLDSIDQLMPAYNAYKMNWLPKELPPNVKIIISTIQEGYPILSAMQEIYSSKSGEFVEVLQLGNTLGMTVIEKWLEISNRTMTDQQKIIVKGALEKCSLPLYARIAFDHIRRWKSYESPSADVLQVTVKGCINQLFDNMEKKFGKPLVQHSLAYLTASRHGLSEVELEHLMSLDDVLLNSIYKFWRPPIRRIPPLLWTRVRSEINSYIVERSADDIIVLFWYHRQFIEASKEKYLSDSTFSKMIHGNMMDYFMGKYGGGKAKPFQYTEHQMKRFGLSDCNSSADRKVPLQPFIIKKEGTHIRVNKRKLFELPFHLLKCKEYEVLKEKVFFNFEWLYATLIGSSPTSLLDEFEIFMKADKQIRREPSMKTLLANLRLIRPYIAKCPESLSYELAGRLSKFVSASPYMESLIKQCDSIGTKYCCVTPMLTCFETADLGLKQNISYRTDENWQEQGCLTCSQDFKTVYIIDYDGAGISHIKSWDLESGDMVHDIPIIKERDASKSDIYVQIRLDPKEQYMIGFYRGKYFAGANKERYFGNGMVDIIQLSDGVVVRQISEFLHNDDFTNPLIWMTLNWLAVKFGPKHMLLHIYEDKKIVFNRPNSLDLQEKYFVLSQCHHGVIREFATKRDCGEFDQEGSILAAAIDANGSVVLLAGPDFGEVRSFDLSKKSLNPDKQSGFLIKSRNKIVMPSQDKEKLMNTMNAETTDVRVQFIISKDFQYAICVYQNAELWMAYMYCVYQGRRVGSYVSQIGTTQPRRTMYPQFSSNGQYVVFASTDCIEIYSSATGMCIHEYDIDQEIKDFCVSNKSDQVAVMMAKDIAVLNIDPVEGESKTDVKRGKKKQTKDITDLTFLPRETYSEHSVLNEYVISQKKKEATIEEVEGAAHILDTDTLASARSKRKFALATRFTPDGLKVVQLHSRVQVVDMQQEEIKYSPQSGDTITRAMADTNGKIVNETVQIPTGSGRSEILHMQSTDRIVNENNRVKFRITSATQNNVKIMSVPSLVTSYSATDGKLKKLKRFTIYQENIETISNAYLVTHKQKMQSDYMNVYELDSGKLVATHEIPGGYGQSLMTLNDNLLISVDEELRIRLFQGPQFTSCESRIDFQSPSDQRKWSIRNILANIPDSGLNVLDSIIVHYKEIGAMTSFYYLHVDLLSKKCTPTKLAAALEDISKDGILAVDAGLVLYDLKSGEQIPHKIPYPNATANMRLQVRLTQDKNYAVFIDMAEETLNIVNIANLESMQHICTCYTHMPRVAVFGGLTLRCQGYVIMIKSQNGEEFFLRLLDEKNSTDQFHYNTEGERALSLVPNAVDIQVLIKQRNENITRKMLLEEQAKNSEYSPINSLSDSEFLHRFRLSKETVNDLVDLLKTDLLKTKDSGKADSLSLHNQILCALRFYATGDMECKVDDQLKINRSTMLHYVEKVSYALERRQSQHISFPVTKQDVQQATAKFSQIANFPRVIGITDCFHTKLNMMGSTKYKESGGENPAVFINPAGYASINTLLTCDADSKFINIHCVYKGSIADNQVFKNSELDKICEDAADKYQVVLLADSAFPCLRYLMTPIKNPKTSPEEAYNTAHKKTMQPMERALSMWKGRFPGISIGLDSSSVLTLAVIIGSCVLHNIAIDKGEQIFPEETPGQKQPHVEEDIPPTSRGENIRKQILQTSKLGEP